MSDRRRPIAVARFGPAPVRARFRDVTIRSLLPVVLALVAGGLLLLCLSATRSTST